MEDNEKKHDDEKKSDFWKGAIPYIVVVIAVVLVRTFIITPIKVDGASMYSTLSDGDILLLKKYDNSYDRFDVVVFRYGNDRLIKRVIGLPGETIEYSGNKLYVNGKYVKEPFLKNNQETFDFKLRKLGIIEIPDDYYFVLGDNRTNSTDSRIIGPVSKDDIQGKTDLVIFPFNKIGLFK